MPQSPPLPIAIIGAGPSGLTALKATLEQKRPATLFEQKGYIGGIWHFDETKPDGGGPAYHSLKSNSSSKLLAFSDFPLNNSDTDFPSHQELLTYFNQYADQFNLRPHIRLNHKIVLATYQSNNLWALQIETPKGIITHSFSALIVATGFYHQPFIPSIPGLDQFSGETLHSYHYKAPEQFNNKKIIVIGTGSSGADIAAETSKTAASVTLVARSPVYFLPHYTKNIPTDYALRRFLKYLPTPLIEHLFEKQLVTSYKQLGFNSEQLKKLLHLPPLDINRFRLTPATELLKQLLAQKVSLKPALTKIEETLVQFADGTTAEPDTLIFATGYKLRFPFLSPTIIEPGSKNYLPLYQHIFHTTIPNLAFLGMCQIRGPLFPVMEMQAKWVARIFAQLDQLPSPKKRTAWVTTHYEKNQRAQTDPMILDYATYIDDLAQKIGIYPKIWKQPHRWRELLFDPLTASQFRKTKE